jgi:hypothetical protein
VTHEKETRTLQKTSTSLPVLTTLTYTQQQPKHKRPLMSHTQTHTHTTLRKEPPCHSHSHTQKHTYTTHTKDHNAPHSLSTRTHKQITHYINGSLNRFCRSSELSCEMCVRRLKERERERARQPESAIPMRARDVCVACFCVHVCLRASFVVL